MDLDGKTRYMVETILKHRDDRGERQYLVHWKGYPVGEATWKPISSLVDESGKNIVQLRNYLSSLRK